MISKLKRTIALAAMMTAMAGVAHAEGWYGRADVGYSVDGALEVDTGDDLDFEDDWMAGLGAGYGFQNGFRLEGELSYRQNDFSDFDGDARALALMANLFTTSIAAAVSSRISASASAARGWRRKAWSAR